MKEMAAERKAEAATAAAVAGTTATAGTAAKTQSPFAPKAPIKRPAKYSSNPNIARQAREAEEAPKRPAASVSSSSVAEKIEKKNAPHEVEGKSPFARKTSPQPSRPQNAAYPETPSTKATTNYAAAMKELAAERKAEAAATAAPAAIAAAAAASTATTEQKPFVERRKQERVLPSWNRPAAAKAEPAKAETATTEPVKAEPAKASVEAKPEANTKKPAPTNHFSGSNRSAFYSNMLTRSATEMPKAEDHHVTSAFSGIARPSSQETPSPFKPLKPNEDSSADGNN